MASDFRSKLTVVLDMEQVALARIRELDLALSAQQGWVFELKKVVDAESQLRKNIKKELSTTWQL